MEFKRTEIISETGTKLGIDVFKDNTINVYMEEGNCDIYGVKDLVVDEFDPCELIDLSKKIIEACQIRIESRGKE